MKTEYKPIPLKRVIAIENDEELKDFLFSEILHAINQVYNNKALTAKQLTEILQTKQADFEITISVRESDTK